jgi:hypothetical protein
MDCPVIEDDIAAACSRGRCGDCDNSPSNGRKFRHADPIKAQGYHSFKSGKVRIDIKGLGGGGCHPSSPG